MNYEAKLFEAKNRVLEAKNALDRAEEMMKMSSDLGMELPWDLIEKDLDKAYISAMGIGTCVQEIMAMQGHPRNKCAAECSGDTQSSGLVSASFCADTGVVCLRISAPPPLKKRASASKFLAAISPEIVCKVVEILPENFVPYSSSSVIFIHHYEQSTAKTTSYYDNDNLAIKGLLDNILPYVCGDDAFVFCDNFYLSQPGTATYAEVIVVPRGKLMRWTRTRKELEFSREFGVEKEQKWEEAEGEEGVK